MSAVAKVLPIVAGVALIATGVGAPAGAGLLGTIGAGAMITGGALTLYGAATGNTQLEKVGGLIGIGGVAMGMMAPAAGTEAAAGGAAATGADTGGMQVATDMGTGAAPASTASAAADAGTAANAGTFTRTPSLMDMASPTGSAAGVAPAATAADVQAAVISGQQQMLKYSLLSGAASGAANAYGQRQQADIAARTAANQLALQQEIARRANSAGTIDATGTQGGLLQSGGAQPGQPAVPPPITPPNVFVQPPLGIAPPAIAAPQPLRLA